MGMHCKLFIAALALTSVSGECTQPSKHWEVVTPIVGAMSLEEKIGQMT
jgi:hypothetical protein